MRCMKMANPFWLQKAINTVKWECEKKQVTLGCLFGKYGKDFIIQKEDYPPFSIGIVTYIIRFSIFKALLKKVHKTFPHTQIIVAVNGYYKPDSQRKFLEEIQEYVQQFPNVSLITHSEPQGLCTLWNRIILAAKNEKVFIMNDDIDIAPHFSEAFLSSGILNKEMALINESWSHFLISKKTIEKVGWFDERLYGIGGEDWDYEARLAFADIPLDIFPMKGILNLSIYTSDFSFGEDVERIHHKYTMSSAVFLRKKWDISNSNDPHARFVRIWNNYVRLNKGFETPVFYNLALLRNEKTEADRTALANQQ